ncbi:hypothetical protein AVEN_66442-1 [Araneus ventricosus]|uniref:Uncharacterized protein n=1 Tax=Araneus ventricosus TaxID=182803 RepID=A0A4Y2NUQ1_ARAVE|nr:hypothetical protein AVEN_66442-1 [Araneus ventricosus]
MLEEWQTTGRMRYRKLFTQTSCPSVRFRRTNWIRDRDVSPSLNMDLPCLPQKISHLLSRRIILKLGGIGTHFTMPRVYLQCLGIRRKPAPNLNKNVLKYNANNLSHRHKIQTVKFI